MADFSSRITEITRKRHKIFPVLKDKNCQPQILYPEKIGFRNKGEIKIFSDKEILNEFISSRATLQKNKIKS